MQLNNLICLIPVYILLLSINYYFRYHKSCFRCIRFGVASEDVEILIASTLNCFKNSMSFVICPKGHYCKIKLTIPNFLGEMYLVNYITKELELEFTIFNQLFSMRTLSPTCFVSIEESKATHLCVILALLLLDYCMNASSMISSPTWTITKETSTLGLPFLVK